LLLDRVLLARLLATGRDAMVTFLARVLLDTVVGGQALALAVHALGSMRTVGAGGRRGRGRYAVAIGVESACAGRTRCDSSGVANALATAVKIAFADRARCDDSRLTNAIATAVKIASAGWARCNGSGVANTVAIGVKRAFAGRARCNSIGVANALARWVEIAFAVIAICGGHAVRDTLAIFADFTGCNVSNFTHCAGLWVAVTEPVLASPWVLRALSSGGAGIHKVRRQRQGAIKAVAAIVAGKADLAAFARAKGLDGTRSRGGAALAGEAGRGANDLAALEAIGEGQQGQSKEYKRAHFD